MANEPGTCFASDSRERKHTPPLTPVPPQLKIYIFKEACNRDHLLTVKLIQRLGRCRLYQHREGVAGAALGRPEPAALFDGWDNGNKITNCNRCILHFLIII